MPDITTLIASIRKEVGGAEPGTLFGDVLKLCAWAENVNSPDHYVTFDKKGWIIEHSGACRDAGTIGTCAFNDAIRQTANIIEPAEYGRWRITGIDDAGLPSLERADKEGSDEH